MKIIEYNGETLETKHYKEMTQEKFEQLKKEYYERPQFDIVKNQFIAISKGGVKNNEISKYYVKDLMAKTKIYYNKWSIEDVFNCKDLLCRFYAQIDTNDKVFPKDKRDIDNIETAIRLGGKGVASKPANFPIKTIDEILEYYNVNNNWYDFSCGWGDRLLGALKHKVNYFGTDPNYLLTERLKQLASDYKSTLNQETMVDIKTQGSEIYIPEWENKIGLAFSSPPYFYLEDYKIGNQSWKLGTSYQEWKDNYLEPTFKNIYKYLIDSGYFIININNFKEFKLVEDTIDIAKKVGFNIIGEHKLNNIKRCKSSGGFNDNSEKILVFMKGSGEIKQSNEQLSIFDIMYEGE